MNKNNVNTTIESDAIETKSQKVVRTVADKVLTVIIGVLTLVLVVSVLGFLVEVKSEMSYTQIEDPEDLLQSMDYSSGFYRIAQETHEVRVMGADEKKYAVVCAIGDYIESSILENTYSYAGDEEKASYYADMMEESRNRMVDSKSGQSLTIYADRIDKRMTDYKYK